MVWLWVKEQSGDLKGKISGRTKKKKKGRKVKKGKYEEKLEHVEHGSRFSMYT